MANKKKRRRIKSPTSKPRSTNSTEGRSAVLTTDGAGSGWFGQLQPACEDGSGAELCNVAGCGACDS